MMLDASSRTAIGICSLHFDADIESILVSFNSFTKRQMQVMDELADGSTNKEIASRLNLAEGTVKAYVTKFYERTRCSNRVKLAIYWLLYRGVVVLPPVIRIEGR